VRKPLAPAAWKKRHVPTAKDHHIEQAWLDEHATYGGRVHEVAADAILEAFKKQSVREEGHALYFKLFAEYANALEVAGAWGWALRTRREHPLLLDAFLTYGPNCPRDFYMAARRNRSGSALLLLNLPSERRTLKALAAVTPELTDAERRQTLAEFVPHAKALARRYFLDDEIMRSAYNRAKHGATMLHDSSLTQRQFWVIAPHLAVANANDKRRYVLPKFTVQKSTILSTHEGVRAAGAMIRYLALVAKALNGADLLYPNPTRTLRLF
jgi:hypothetical protein